ncbi:MAG: LamG domain-containing protein, partial [bacterium]|nr:LamG domain-containing protein [bacterium]
MKHMRTSTAGMLLLGMIVIPQLNGDVYEEEVLSDDPIVYYRFEETEPGPAEDSSGFDRHGMYVGSLQFDQPSAAGGIGRAVLFDGLTGFVQMAPLNLEIDQLTIEAWVNVSSLAGGCCTSIFSPDGWQPGWLHYNLKNNSTLEFALNSGGPNNHNTDPGSVPFDTWIYIASVYDKAEALVKIYMNGEEVSVNPPGFTNPQTVRLIASAQVGAWQNSRFLPGLMDEFALYDSALSAERIRAHFDAATLDPRCPSGLTAERDATGVKLAWTLGTVVPTGVRVVRNGTELAASAPADPPQFVDATAAPGALSYELTFAGLGPDCPPLTQEFNACISNLSAAVKPGQVELSWKNNFAYTQIQVRRSDQANDEVI